MLAGMRISTASLLAARSVVGAAPAASQATVPGGPDDEAQCTIGAKRSASSTRKRHPGSHGFSERRHVEGRAPEAFRVKLAAYARRGVKKGGGSRILSNLGIRRADGLFHNNPNPGGRARSELTTR
jgi:hypothetical protein